MRIPLKFLEGWLTAAARTFSSLFADISRSLRDRRGHRPPSTRARLNGTDRNAIVKSRPASLEQRYQLIEDKDYGDEVFTRLQDRLFSLANQGMTDRSGQRIVYKERGRIAPDRAYFYLKPNGSSGLLFERSGPGWVVSRAEKFVDRDLFLREGPVLEHANVFLADNRATLPRIRSDLMGDDLLAFGVYEQKLLRHLGLE